MGNKTSYTQMEQTKVYTICKNRTETVSLLIFSGITISSIRRYVYAYVL